jgi:HD superfamily phosphodiesterase
MNLTSRIESAEQQFKQILEDFFVTVYDENSLPSHGLEHHRRVWHYASELILSIENLKILTDPSLPENLIIASYLHDIGMSVDPGIKHGHHSRNLCMTFLKKNNLDAGNYQLLLSAIENHDNKEYKTLSKEYDLLTILSVADDLDAFGFIGIYRYSEIYLTRGVKHEELGQLILKNVTQRFDNFVKTFGGIDSIVLRQIERYNILKDFFNNYNSQVKSYTFDSQNPSGYCGVIELFSKMMKERKGLEEIHHEVENNSDDQVIKWFFNGLATELLV